MLIYNLNDIGNRLLEARKKLGYTQAEVAELAGISDRTYADIERGTVNMRLLTFLQICSCLKVTPNDILTKDQPSFDEEAFLEALGGLNEKQKVDALRILSVFIESIK